MTLECRVEDMSAEYGEPQTYRPVTFVPAEGQSRCFRFAPVLYHDDEPDKDIEIAELELTPFPPYGKRAITAQRSAIPRKWAGLYTSLGRRWRIRSA